MSFYKEAAKLFLERANNNVGLIIPGIAPLRDTFWGKWLWQNPKMFDDLKVFMDEIHKTDTKLFVQLTVGMGRSWAITELVAPSRWAHDIECPEMTKEQIDVWLDSVSMPVVDCLGDDFLAYVKDGMTITVKEDGVIVVE